MALRSAMNPHFIFNCLNSIQYYILENDQKNAVTYLSTFSKLIRSILNNSVKNRVRLSEELDMLNLYVTLEAIRFENKFDFEVKVGSEVDIESIEIPSMLIQPYVENAILHGLCNKKEKGLLKISVNAEDGMVLFEIEDNGIGRDAASKLKQMNLSQHKSMGTALTEERLKLINSDTASVEILDLVKDDGGFGTKVRVRVKE
jgi:sensor histidine kinase YesM